MLRLGRMSALGEVWPEPAIPEAALRIALLVDVTLQLPAMAGIFMLTANDVYQRQRGLLGKTGEDR
jgi:hypothetical protein